MRRTLFLLRWSLRDLRRRWILVATLALVVALATGVGAGLGSMQTWRERSNDASFALLHMHDLRVSLTGESFVAGGTLAAAARRSTTAPGIQALQERLVVPTQLDASGDGRTLVVPGKLIGVPLRAGGVGIDGRFVQIGRDLRASDQGRTVAVIEGNFRNYHDLQIPRTASVAGGRRLTLVGAVLQPEQFLVTRPGADFGAEAGYAVLYAPLQTVEQLSRHPGQVNELVLSLRPDVDPASAARALESAFARALPQLGVTVTAKADEDSYRILYADARTEQRLVDVFAWLLLAGAAFASFNLVSRVIESQRRELGIGMALGASPGMLALRPLLFAAEVSLLGVAGGIGIGIGFDRVLRGELENMLTLPIWTTPLLPDIYLRAAALGFAVPLLAALYPVWRAVRRPPVWAIQVGSRTAAGSGLAPLFERLHLPGSTLAKMPFRNVLRTPRRTLMSLLGIGAILTILIALAGTLDSFDKTLGVTRAETVRGSPDRTVVTLVAAMPSSGPAVERIRRSSLVAAVEPAVVLPTTVRAPGHSVEARLELLDPASAVWRPRITGGSFDRTSTGIVLSKPAAAQLGVRPGDQITLAHPVRTGASEFRTATTTTTVAAVHAIPLQTLAYMASGRAGIFGLAAQANTLEIRPRAGATSGELTRALFAAPGVASVEPAAAIPDALHSYMDNFLGILRITQLITLLLALLIAFNTSSIAGEERRREHATMFAFGLPTRSILSGAVVESSLIGILGTIAGIGLGLGVLTWVVDLVRTDVFPELGTVVSLSPLSVATAVLVGVLVVGLAPLLGTRQLRRMDIPATLRVAE